MITDSLPPNWQTVLQKELQKPYIQKIDTLLTEAYRHSIVYPPRDSIFAALTLCPLESVHVVILGQDPYHGPDQANGLAFSVTDTAPLPPSLKNIFAEITADVGALQSSAGNLARWATQGVLLLNTTLTVAAGQPGSHRAIPWSKLTQAILTAVNDSTEHTVFLLWGSHAASARSLIDTTRHLVLSAPHPSPLSAYRGFFGCRHFSQTNTYLTQHGKQAIVW